MAGTGMGSGTGSGTGTDKGPLPIWFFVGLVLGVYGLLVLGAAIVGGAADTALSRKLPGVWLAANPGLWWGGTMTAAGVVFTLIGLRRPR